MAGNGYIKDERTANEFAAFLDEYFYAKQTYFSSKRIADACEQKKGIDILLDNYKVDEKTALYYANSGLSTFAFEISYLSSYDGAVKNGWFIDSSFETELYFLFWVKTVDGVNPRRVQKDVVSNWRKNDFAEAEGYLIGKDTIKEFLSKNGYSTMALLRKSAEIRTNGITGRYEDFYLSGSNNYCEAPINILIPKKILFELAEFVFIINKNNFKQVKQVK